MNFVFVSLMTQHCFRLYRVTTSISKYGDGLVITLKRYEPQRPKNVTSNMFVKRRFRSKSLTGAFWIAEDADSHCADMETLIRLRG